MIQSRRKFLSKGYYDGVSDEVNQAVTSLISEKHILGSLEVLDAGCGEGFYLKRLKDALHNGPGAGSHIGYYGLDISRYAIRQATQYDKAISWIVGNIANLSFLDSSLDVVINVFAITHFKEFSRVLRDRGSLLLLYPGSKHLMSLRRAIYSEVTEHTSAELLRQSKDDFDVINTTNITYKVQLCSSEDIKNLLLMTPYYWNINLETRVRVESLEELPLEIDIMISFLQKK